MTTQQRPGDREPSAEAAPLTLLKPHWRLVLACFLGWFLDAFDQVAIILVLSRIAKDFQASLTAMGFILTVQAIGRIFGNIGWGWLADHYGRKLTFMLGVIWFAAFSGLSGLAWSYAALLVIQFFFGIGFGGEWTASASLLMESVPARARAMASSLMMAGYEFGFFAAAGMQALLVPHFGWRSLFFVGVVPAILAIFIRVGIDESPVWLRAQREGKVGKQGSSLGSGFSMTAAAWQACAFMAMLQFQTAALYSFYPTLLETTRDFGPDLVFLAIACYSIGSITGKLACGWFATHIGNRWTILGCLAITLATIYPFTSVSALPLILLTAFVVGGSSSGVFALVPHYLSLRFSNAVRSFGMGLAYAVAAFSQGVATLAVPAASVRLGLALGIVIFVVGSSLAVAAIVFREPEELPGRDMEGEDELAAVF